MQRVMTKELILKFVKTYYDHTNIFKEKIIEFIDESLPKFIKDELKKANGEDNEKYRVSKHNFIKYLTEKTASSIQFEI